MSHLPAFPILIPTFAGFLLLLFRRRTETQRAISVAATLLLLAVGVWGVGAAGSGPLVYQLGDWPAPYGIVLVLDRLSALMVLLTAVTAMAAVIAASHVWDREGSMFHALFQFQLMGICGAFLTGDIFNLFVFFEVLLIASYGLLLHGGGAERGRAGLKYVTINLAGSALFLVAVAVIYGVTGTLNMADLAEHVANAPADDLGLIRASALLFLVVFGTKAALLPVMFWLPDTYSSATAPVAALFAIMTKIGLYAILRVYTLCFADLGAETGAFMAPWLLGAGLATLAAGMAGALAARSLRRLTAYLTIASVGTTLIAISAFSAAAIAAGLYYLVHSTLAVAGLFLLCDPIARARPGTADRLEPGQPLAGRPVIALAFMALAVAAAGIPPLSGFLGKAMILGSLQLHPQVGLVWAVVLVTSLMAVVSLSRAGSLLFWKPAATPVAGPVTGPRETGPVAALLVLMVALTVLAGPAEGFTRATAAALLEPQAYLDAVLGNRGGA